MISKKYDLAVIGSGILGTFHAYHAAALGKKTLLVEKDQYPVNSTVRNFGQVVPSGLNTSWFDLGLRSNELYKTIQADFDISVRNNGSVYIASDDDETQLIHELKERMDDRHYSAHLLSRQQCLAKWPTLKSDYCKEGLYFPDELSVEPDKMIRRVIDYAVAKYPHLDHRPSTTIIDCAISSNEVVLRTSNGETFIADKAIICNGGEFKLLFADVFKASGIVVSKLQMLRTIPLPSVQLAGNILTGLTIRRYESFEECPSFHQLSTPKNLEELQKWGIHILFKQSIDNSIIIGDSHEYASSSRSDELGFSIKGFINELMFSEASRIVSFDVRQISESWAGFYPQHPDKAVVEYDLEGRVHVRTAIGGKGMTSGPGYAEKSIRRIFELS
jgi:FAD dependent oxidoreductase TIGR03364